MARPEDYQGFVRAVAEKRVELNWGYNSVQAWARGLGYEIPLFFGVKKAVLGILAESEENFSHGMITGGIDVFIPDEYLTTYEERMAAPS